MRDDNRLTESQTDLLIKALQVLVLDPRIRGWLAAHDIKALAQAREALRQAGAPATESEAPDDGHWHTCKSCGAGWRCTTDEDRCDETCPTCGESDQADG